MLLIEGRLMRQKLADIIFTKPSPTKVYIQHTVSSSFAPFTCPGTSPNKGQHSIASTMNHDWCVATRDHRVDTKVVKPCQKQVRKRMKDVWKLAIKNPRRVNFISFQDLLDLQNSNSDCRELCNTFRTLTFSAGISGGCLFVQAFGHVAESIVDIIMRYPSVYNFKQVLSKLHAIRNCLTREVASGTFPGWVASMSGMDATPSAHF